MDCVDHALLLNVAARIDWRSVQALSCTQRSFCAAARDEGVQQTSQLRSVDENWRDGRFVERQLPSELKHTLHLRTGCVGGFPVLAAVLGRFRRRRTNEKVVLFDCRTQRRLARLVDAPEVGHDHAMIVDLGMVTDGGRALVLRHTIGGEAGSSCAVYLYDQNCIYDCEGGKSVPSLAPLFRIEPQEHECRVLGAQATRVMDRVFVHHVVSTRPWRPSLVSHDVATGGRAAGVVLKGWHVKSIFGQDDGHLLALGVGAGTHQSYLLRYDWRTLGTFRRAAFSRARFLRRRCQQNSVAVVAVPTLLFCGSFAGPRGGSAG
ncbi:Hypothetical protein UVM_LOCUS370 [uncultured virus]|nr:Hypothetical protein UVM_LOCUS370 [uncultured virus]